MTALWEGIDAYLAACAPKDWHHKEVSRYRQRIHDAIKDEFRLMSFYQSGSFKHGTAVTPYSDVDYIARIHFEDRPTSSTTVLNKIRDVLASEFAGETWDVHVDRPAVTLRFHALVTDYEITPAYLARGSTDDDRVVLIPAPGGGWREAAPKAHNKFVADMDKNHSGDVREVARLLKAWKYEHSVPISSFYLEMRAAEYGKNHNSVWPLTAMRSIVGHLITNDLPAMNDPTKLVARINPCYSATARATTLTRLKALKKNLDSAITLYFAKDSNRWNLNQALVAIWGADFPYCDTYNDTYNAT